MANEMQVFNYEGNEVRTVMVNAEPMFVAADVCRILEVINPTDALKRLDEDERTLVSIEGASNGKPVNAVTEAGLYSLILGSRKSEAKKFKRWVTHDVLPSIRKRGLYAVDDVLANPDMLIAALIDLKAERERVKRLECDVAARNQIISEMAPKASYYDMVLATESAVPITVIAKDYGMSAKRLNALLHDSGVQYKMDNTWLLYAEYANQGYTKSTTYAVTDSKAAIHTKWTQKGRLFIYDLLKNEYGILPMMERSDVA